MKSMVLARSGFSFWVRLLNLKACIRKISIFQFLVREILYFRVSFPDYWQGRFYIIYTDYGIFKVFLGEGTSAKIFNFLAASFKRFTRR